MNSISGLKIHPTIKGIEIGGVISRDAGEPWGSTGLTSLLWLAIPVAFVKIRELIFTQPGVYFHALARVEQQPFGGDPYPHVVIWQGRSYLEDGHHRTMRAMLTGRKRIAARVFRM